MEEKLAKIATYYLGPYKQDFRQNSPSLLGGRGGVLIFQTMLYKITGDERFNTEVKDNVEFIIRMIENFGATLAPTHAVGLAGTGCLLYYLHEQGMIDVDMDEFLTDVDEYLIENLDEFNKKKEYDILHGALGIGLYFIRRGNTEQVEKTICALDESKLEFNDEVTWSRYDKIFTKEDIIDLGLAHGNGSILYFLVQCYKNGIMKEKVRALSERLLTFLFNNTQDPETYRSVFPYHITVAEYKNRTFTPRYARLAWCYGDMGMLYLVLAATKTLGITKYDDRIKQYINYQTTRTSYENTGVKDAGFCHGSSGVAYLWKKIYEVTKDPQHNAAAALWLDKTHEFGSIEEGIAGYQFHMGDTGWQNTSDILTGLAGVGMTFVANEDNYEYDGWDGCFYLDI